MDKLIIRDMTEDDIPAVMEIEKNSFSSPWTEYMFLGEIYRKYGFQKVALSRERIIAYICVSYMLHESHILNLAVHRDFRRRGAASALMNEAILELKKRGCVFMYLEVRASNAGAQKFYELFGFRVENVRKKYYGNPDEDALLMVGRV